MAIPLRKLIDGTNVPNVMVTGLTNDSRRVCPDNVFFAYKGHFLDGFDYVDSAIRQGAVVIIGDRPAPSNVSVPWLHFANIRKVQSEIAARFYNNPSNALNVIGITGTNGKSSIAYGLASLLHETACMGTLGWGQPPSLRQSELTTVDSILIQQNLSQLLQEGFSRVAMEVSSHALVQDRVSNVRFDCAVFTNLSRDHLDYHANMSEYANAKKKLFQHPNLRCGIVNIDDPIGRSIASQLRAHDRLCWSYGTSEDAQLRWRNVKSTATGFSGVWQGDWGEIPFELPFCIEASIVNSAALLLVSLFYQQDIEKAVEKMENLPQVPGRMELISDENQPKVVLDYAHTPAALATVLYSLKKRTPGKLLCVFGCGGDRDRGKRPEMAAAAEQYADRVYVTTDNPRFESPVAIVEDVLGGFTRHNDVVIELDRARAIQEALAFADEYDTVLIAGKGNEDYQDIEGEQVPYSDRHVIIETLRGTVLC